MILYDTCIILLCSCIITSQSHKGFYAGTRYDDDAIHESVGGYYDNNNQYHYRIQEPEEYPDVRVDFGSRGSSSSTRRPLSTHHHHYHPEAVLGDVDMSDEVGMLMDHLLVHTKYIAD